MLPLGVIGPTQILVIVILIIVLFGGKKIPELMRGMGRGVKEFKDAVNKDYTAENTNETTARPLLRLPERNYQRRRRQINLADKSTRKLCPINGKSHPTTR